MALGTVSGTGPIAMPDITRAAFLTFSYCSSGVSGLGQAYVGGVSGDQSILDFGQNLSEIIFINTGATNIAFQWKERWGQNVDSGVVPPGATITMRKAIKSGMKVRCADTAGVASCIVWGF